MVVNDRGFSLVEVLIAASILVVVLCGVAGLFTMVIHANVVARHTTLMSILAAGKVEELRGVLPADPVLARSPPGVLDANVDRYCEFLDGAGSLVGAGTVAPAGARYVRRWSVQPMPADPDHASIVQVRVLERITGGESRLLTAIRRGAP